METFELNNGTISAKVSEMGAELTSIVFKGQEQLWQADPTFWKRHSPVLFPIVGRLWDDKYRVDGREYTLSQHGFARDMPFTLVSHTPTEARFVLRSNAETLEKYPYQFKLEIEYRLTANSIQVTWVVYNTDVREIHFQIGAHPAFYLRDFNPADDIHGNFRIDKPGRLSRLLIAEKGCIGVLFETEDRDSGSIPIDNSLFDNDALIYDHNQIQKVWLCDKTGHAYIAVSFNAPALGLWSPRADCPFVCIEPWYGLADRQNYKGEFRDKQWMNHLAPNKIFVGGYTMEFLR